MNVPFLNYRYSQQYPSGHLLDNVDRMAISFVVFYQMRSAILQTWKDYRLTKTKYQA
jgi:hypothetical protein